jgi:hypothetical protein
LGRLMEWTRHIVGRTVTDGRFGLGREGDAWLPSERIYSDDDDDNEGAFY